MGLPVSPAELWHCTGTPPVSPRPPSSLGWKAACLEEAPFVADALHGLRAHPVVVIGFFANQGGHVRDDMPALIAAEQAGRGDAGLPVQFDGSAIDDPAIVLIILAQATCVGD